LTWDNCALKTIKVYKKILNQWKIILFRF
jgi:hypothetical protein